MTTDQDRKSPLQEVAERREAMAADAEERAAAAERWLDVEYRYSHPERTFREREARRLRALANREADTAARARAAYERTLAPDYDPFDF